MDCKYDTILFSEYTLVFIYKYIDQYINKKCIGGVECILYLWYCHVFVFCILQWIERDGRGPCSASSLRWSVAPGALYIAAFI